MFIFPFNAKFTIGGVLINICIKCMSFIYVQILSNILHFFLGLFLTNTFEKNVSVIIFIKVDSQ